MLALSRIDDVSKISNLMLMVIYCKMNIKTRLMVLTCKPAYSDDDAISNYINLVLILILQCMGTMSNEYKVTNFANIN